MGGYCTSKSLASSLPLLINSACGCGGGGGGGGGKFCGGGGGIFCGGGRGRLSTTPGC